MPTGYALRLSCMPFTDARMEKLLPHQMKTTKWSLTYWFTDGRNMDTLNECIQRMPPTWHLEGQIERGEESGKEHAQLYLKTPQTRGTAIAKVFPQTDIQEARNHIALQQYVHKEETRIGEFKTITNTSPQWSVVRDKFFDWLLETEPFYGHVKDDMDERVSPRLNLWDKFIIVSIKEGMNIDVIGVNPQYRSCIRRYWEGYVYNAEQRLAADIDKKTDKTKDNFLDAVAPPLQIPTIPVEGGVVSSVKKVRKLRLPKE